MYEVKNDVTGRTIRLRMSGIIKDEEMRRACGEMRRATDAYNGTAHMVLADIRGLATIEPSVAAMMGETMAYQRKRGVSLCAHLSDSSIVRLQANRLARESSAQDKSTIDVVSLEEAERVLSEARPGLLARR